MYLAAAATSIFLPSEIYDLAGKVTWLRVVALVINLLLVIYLVWAKRLFGARGGKAAYEARLRSVSVLEVELAALTAASPGPATEPAQAHPAPPPHPRHRRKTMRSSTPEVPPARVPAAQVAAGPAAAETARPAALTARLADLAAYTAEIAAAMLGGPF